MSDADDETPQARARRQRAARILDAAADLLLRRGYARVTIDDIAAHADIGKGTIYLHWKTKEALFAALLLREAVAMWRALLQRIREDPREAYFHRILRAVLLLQMQRPLARALFTGDRELLGKLVRSDAGRHLRARQAAAQGEVLAWMRARGLLRADLEPGAQRYALRAIVRGFLLAEGDPGEHEPPPLEVRADALAHTIRCAFEPDAPPTGAALRSIADELCARLGALCDAYERQSGDPPA